MHKVMFIYYLFFKTPFFFYLRKMHLKVRIHEQNISSSVNLLEQSGLTKYLTHMCKTKAKSIFRAYLYRLIP